MSTEDVEAFSSPSQHGLDFERDMKVVDSATILVGSLAIERLLGFAGLASCTGSSTTSAMADRVGTELVGLEVSKQLKELLLGLLQSHKGVEKLCDNVGLSQGNVEPEMGNRVSGA